MNYLSIENISKSYDSKVLFNNISFGIEKGQKVALIAKNGTGKTTLLRLIAGVEKPDSGNIVLRNEIKLTLLEQEPNLKDQSVIEVIFDSHNPVIKAVKDYEYCLQNPVNDSEKMQKALEQMDKLKAWDFELKAKQILTQLKLNIFDKNVNTLSGGQRKRVALAKVLIEEPDFLILDEPTNHLDFEMIEWLESYLENQNITLLMVTHDRYFLEKVCNEILELDKGNIYKYKGNYSYFLDKKAEREENEIKNLDKANNLFRKELEWIRRGPKARGTKAKYRVDAFHKLKEKIDKKTSSNELQLEVKMSRLGGKILEISNLNKSYEDQIILNDFNYAFKRQEKIGIVGKNGVGKSTFLNLITGKIQPDKGIIEKGETIVLGYYSQEGIKLDKEKRVIDVVKEIAEVVPLGNGKSMSASQFLERFLFPPESQYKYVSTLSGGEKRRLYLLTILIKNPNFLILDEPTNDLDILTLNVLENFLEDFQGCLIIVTHDRYFMNKLVDHLFIFEGDGIISNFNGNYDEYKEFLKSQNEEIKKTEKKSNKDLKEKNIPSKKKLSYKEKLEFEKLEKEIEELESKKEILNNEINSGTLDYNVLQKHTEELVNIIKEIDLKTERWIELSEFAE